MEGRVWASFHCEGVGGSRNACDSVAQLVQQQNRKCLQRFKSWREKLIRHAQGQGSQSEGQNHWGGERPPLGMANSGQRLFSSQVGSPEKTKEAGNRHGDLAHVRSGSVHSPFLYNTAFRGCE